MIRVQEVGGISLFQSWFFICSAERVQYYGATSPGPVFDFIAFLLFSLCLGTAACRRGVTVAELIIGSGVATILIVIGEKLEIMSFASVILYGAMAAYAIVLMMFWSKDRPFALGNSILDKSALVSLSFVVIIARFVVTFFSDIVVVISKYFDFYAVIFIWSWGICVTFLVLFVGFLLGRLVKNSSSLN